MWRKHDFGVKSNFSKIRIAHVMLNFLATTENIRNKIRTTELQSRESGQFNQREIAFRNFRHSNSTRVELSYLDMETERLRKNSEIQLNQSKPSVER